MCLILDTNKYGDFLNPKNTDMQPVRDWMKKNGKIAYSPTTTMKNELNKHSNMKAKFADYRRSGKLKQFPKNKVDACEKKLPDLQSNDGHIIALAMVAKVKLLVSSDKALHADFKNRQLAGGNIYQYNTQKQKRLLGQDTCP